MKHDINIETPLIPYIIAERAIWNMLEIHKKELTPIECAKIVSDNCQLLVDKAEYIYNCSDHFRKEINHKRKDCRYTLEMYMEHWTLGLLKIKN